MPFLTPKNSEITLNFTSAELLQLEAIATLHGVSVTDFVQRAALEAAQITAPEKSSPNASALWISDLLQDSNENRKTGAAPDLLAPVERDEQRVQPVAAAKRGVAGEPSSLAKGLGPVWEIRRALGQERVHGLGWTREHLAFVLKLSVVGVRKMEHLGTSPIKSIEARRNLLELARLLQNPTPEIAAYIEAETAAIGS